MTASDNCAAAPGEASNATGCEEPASYEPYIDH